MGGSVSPRSSLADGSTLGVVTTTVDCVDVQFLETEIVVLLDPLLKTTMSSSNGRSHKRQLSDNLRLGKLAKLFLSSGHFLVKLGQ